MIVGGSDRSRSGTSFSRRLLIRRDRHLACGAPAKADREARQRPRRAVAPRWGGGNSKRTWKGCPTAWSSSELCDHEAGVFGRGSSEEHSKGPHGFEAPVSCSASCLRAVSRAERPRNRAHRGSSSRALNRPACNTSTEPVGVGASSQPASVTRRATHGSRIGEDALEERTFACSSPSPKGAVGLRPLDTELPLDPRRARGCLGSRPG